MAEAEVTTDERSPASPRVWTTLVLCMAAALLEGLDNQSIGAVAPRLGKALHLSHEALGPIFTAGTVGLFLGAAIGGRIADRFGYRAVIAGAITILGLGSLATTFAFDGTSLFATRFLTGLGLGGAMPNLLALVSSAVRPERRGAAVSAVYAGMPFGGAAAAALTLIGPADAWRPVFYVGGLVPILLAPLLALFLPPGRPGARMQARERMAPVTQVLFGGGRAAATLLLWAAFFLTLLILYLLLNWLPTLTASRGYDRTTVAGVQTAFNLFGAIACVVAGGLFDAKRRAPFVIAIYLVFGLSLAGLGALTAQPWVEIALGGALGAGLLLGQAVLYDAAPKLYPAAMRGTGVGWAVAMGRAGSITGPLLGAALVAHGSPASVLTRLLPIMALGGVLTLLQIWRAGKSTMGSGGVA